ncbi:hypothetical protein LTR91_009826 [Friedmanniomyces endolithicus]|uniref:DNA/RNA-binding protein Kin17 WH-like domain-containing protein n=1 Tax=Friedmanniomyces endolithicus TaxID=329885 RepID=A0AAN6QTC4_9PEZI|nr:hypothetical protein LTR91_009826 [Friedmanniomyces endolithicus]KAK1006563.1 hypothetical protein LTS01_002926 [Friedmanniomyces endolithicus]
MPKAEVGSTKYLANKMKAKGLQRLRWYCQTCEKQCRDENGFKQHTMSEGHVRAMLLVGEDPRKAINEYSNQFKRDFLQLLKTSHGEKKVSLNGFYQEYIRDKEHVHMNSTKWPSLTEFAKYMGREGICRVEEGDRGLEVQWVDDSAEAITRREDIKKKERLAKGDESMESRLLEQQIRKAREAAAEKAGKAELPRPSLVSAVEITEPVKVSLNLSGKAAHKQEAPPLEEAPDAPVAIETFSALEEAKAPAKDTPPPKMSISLAGNKPKHSNPLMKKNPLAKKKETPVSALEKKMSNAERIMREELERKRLAEERGHGGGKRQRVA